jgi:hypothetical protein
LFVDEIEEGYEKRGLITNARIFLPPLIISAGRARERRRKKQSSLLEVFEHVKLPASFIF